MAIIETNKLTKFYGKYRGINEINLTVEDGDYFGFIGPNGAGKSTTIRILLGLITQTSGSAKIFGKDTIKNNKEILNDIGYMPSEAMFYEHMRVKDVILLSANLRKKNCYSEAKNLCERLNLDVNKRIEELSLGNRKKVAIVCAFQHNPKLYILDEPTSGLDPLMQKEFFDLLRERHKNDATIFLSSHILSEIQKNCTRTAIIKEGKIIACNKVDELSKTNTRRVTIVGINNIPKSINAKSISIIDNTISFLYQGNMKILLKELSNLPIEDITVTEPDLEEIFLHYYQKDGATE